MATNRLDLTSADALRAAVQEILSEPGLTLRKLVNRIRAAREGQGIEPYGDSWRTSFLIATGAGMSLSEITPSLTGWSAARLHNEITGGSDEFQFLVQRMAAMARIGGTRMVWDEDARPVVRRADA